MPKDKGKGNNPRSHHNKPKVGAGAKPKEITLASEQWLLIKAVGDGNHSRGVRKLVEALSKAKIALVCLLENTEHAQELAEEVLLELEDLEIEQAYEDALRSGAIKPLKGDAYII